MQSRARLLIVEDNDDTAQALQAGLQQLGYEVAVAHNGPLALRIAQEFLPQIAVLDIGLPVMDGWELARRLRNQTDGLKIIAITGQQDDAARIKSAELGFAEHLLKPFDIQSLHAALQRLHART
jgi:DNA-binding response OmpR family regulator